MKGDVEKLVKLVDSYIADLKDAVSQLHIEGMATGTLPIHKKAKLEMLNNKLRYIRHEKDRALYVDAEYSNVDQKQLNIPRSCTDR